MLIYHDDMMIDGAEVRDANSLVLCDAEDLTNEFADATWRVRNSWGMESSQTKRLIQKVDMFFEPQKIVLPVQTSWYILIISLVHRFCPKQNHEKPKSGVFFFVCLISFQFLFFCVRLAFLCPMPWLGCLAAFRASEVRWQRWFVKATMEVLQEKGLIANEEVEPKGSKESKGVKKRSEASAWLRFKCHMGR